MIRVLERLGRWLERLRGPRTTTMITRDRWGKTYSLRYVAESESHAAYIESERLIYRVSFHRWWIPDIVSCVFRVQGHVRPDQTSDAEDGGAWRENIPPEFFQASYYPSLTGWLLQWTNVPHLYAIHSHLDRFHIRRDGQILI